MLFHLSHKFGIIPSQSIGDPTTQLATGVGGAVNVLEPAPFLREEQPGALFTSGGPIRIDAHTRVCRTKAHVKKANGAGIKRIERKRVPVIIL